MALKSKSVWAIDIGNNSLKALHLSVADGGVEVIGFENIQHGKILTGSGVKSSERDELVALSLRQFVKEHNVSKDSVIISVPSQNSFARFVNLPPVERKRIPEIVKFEAAQQIPFNINEVQWDWQLMSEADSPEIKVGLFAIKNEVVSSALEYFSGENVRVGCVQMAPMALYNYVLYDHPDLCKSEDQAVVILNIGAEYSDLVVCTKSTVWQRCIPMGGNAFTRAIAEAFKLNFEKAEKLKRTASISKYARQILQAMKPVFTDLTSEIQRSLGFYASSNPTTKLSRMIALGGGTKMRGLLKYLQQTLQMPIEMPDSFMKLGINPNVSAAKFHENVSDFGVVYGLGLQGLDMSRITSNLLPSRIARSMSWTSKAGHFTIAACMLLLVSLLCFVRINLDRVKYKSNDRVRQNVSSIIKEAGQAESKLKAEEGKGAVSQAIIQKEIDLFKNRDVVPQLLQTLLSILPNEKNNPKQQNLYKAFVDGDLETLLGIPRKERKQIFITSMSVDYVYDIGSAGFGEADFIQTKATRTSAKDSGSEEAFQKKMEQIYGKIMLKTRTGSKKAGGGGDAEGKAGFVVTVSGYSPYGDIGELMDPAGVENDPGKWGFITRLMHFDDVFDGNSPFELYKKTELDHFSLQTGEVSLDASMPIGIGIETTRAEKAKVDSPEMDERVLVDPMTKEIISKVIDLDSDGKKKVDRSGKDIYKVNDHWFILDFKFIWKDAPKEI